MVTRRVKTKQQRTYQEYTVCHKKKQIEHSKRKDTKLHTRAACWHLRMVSCAVLLVNKQRYIAASICTRTVQPLGKKKRSIRRLRCVSLKKTGRTTKNHLHLDLFILNILSACVVTGHFCDTIRGAFPGIWFGSILEVGNLVQKQNTLVRRWYQVQVCFQTGGKQV